MSVRILQGDCREVMKTLDAESVDSIVTDPPYHLTNKGGGPAKGLNNAYSRSKAGASSGGFMGMAWDGGDVAFRVETWAEALRVLKPGGYLLAFSATRTYHRMVCAIEDAGFEIRDQIGWAFGSGFPKSHNGPWGGTACKPAWEPIVMARKPLIGTVEENWRKYGTGGLNIDACRVGYGGRTIEEVRKDAGSPGVSSGTQRVVYSRRAGFDDGRKIEFHEKGRWPANLIHDGSEEVLAAFPAQAGASAPVRGTEASRASVGRVTGERERVPGTFHGDSGSAARFFYCAKADRADRNAGLEDPGPQFKQGRTPRDAEKVRAAERGNHHPTVKPTDLMRYLCSLVTPAGGLVLDPFMGSGSTLKAAELEGFSAIGIELDPAYIEIAKRRIAADAPLFADVSTEAAA